MYTQEEIEMGLPELHETLGAADVTRGTEYPDGWYEMYHRFERANGTPLVVVVRYKDDF